MPKKVAQNALISVYNKDGITDFAAGLVKMGWKIYASGGTAKHLQADGMAVTDVADMVGEPILGHRVVTLSREVHAGLMADKTKPEDMHELDRLQIPLIDLVCVDLYPLEDAIQRGADERAVLEATDIGGPTMLRSAAKGRRIVVSNPEQRAQVLQWLADGRPEEESFRKALAARAEYEIARYVLQSARFLGGADFTGFVGRVHAPTKYGENPYQMPAALYADNRIGADPLGLDQFEHVQGMEQSFINTTDIDRLLQTVTHIAAGFARNFGKAPSIAAGVKHGNACGAAVAETLVEAVQKMLEGDPRAIFGGVVMVNGTIDKAVAETLMHHAMEGGTRLLDGVIGSAVTTEALGILTRSKLRVVVNPALESLSESSLDGSRRLRPVRGGALEQPNYTFVLDLSAEHMERHGKLTKQQERDLVLAWAVGSTSNSNTITLVKGGKLIGNGVGQQDRVGAAQLALTRTTTEMPVLRRDGKELELTIRLDAPKLKGAVAYSDSFFPFPDGPQLLADAGIVAILTSSGSVADKTVVETLQRAGVSVVMVPDKVGRGFFAH